MLKNENNFRCVDFISSPIYLFNFLRFQGDISQCHFVNRRRQGHFLQGGMGGIFKKKSFSTQFCNMSDLTNFRWGDLAKICNIPIPYLYPTYNCPSLSRNMLKAWENSKYPRVVNYRVSQKFGAFYIYKSNIQLQQSFFDIIFTNENDTLVAVHRCFYYFL